MGAKAPISCASPVTTLTSILDNQACSPEDRRKDRTNIFAVFALPAVSPQELSGAHSFDLPAKLHSWQTGHLLKWESTVNQDLLAPTPKGRERLDNILTVSTDLFLEKGYDSVTLDDVIAKSGGSRATLYRAFGGKQQLFEAVINDFCSKFFEDLRRVDYTDLDFNVGFHKLARAYMAAALSPRHVHFYRAVMGTANRFPAVGEVWYHKGMKAVSLIFFDFLRSHTSAENVADGEIQQLADSIQGALIFCLLSQSAVLTPAGDAEVASTISAVAQIAERAYRDYATQASELTPR